MIKNEWLKFEEQEGKPKTKVFRVVSKDTDALGIIKWHPPWRHYCFFPTTDFETVHSDICLKNISDFIINLNWKHKIGR